MTAGSGNPWLSSSLGSKAAKERMERIERMKRRVKGRRRGKDARLRRGFAT